MSAPVFVAHETNGLPITVIACGQGDAAVIGAGNLDFGGVHDGIEETWGSDKDAVAGGQQIESTPSIPPTAGPAENIVGGFALLARARATWSMPSRQNHASPFEALVSTEMARFLSGTTAVRET
jgi:hypothetical protein